MAEAVTFDIRAEDKTALAFKAVKEKLGGLTGSIFSLKSALVGALGAYGIGAMIQGAMDAGDQIQKLQQRLGASAEALSELKYAAGMSGIGFDQLAKSLQVMSIGIAKAAQDQGPAREALHDLGLDAQALIALKPEQQLMAIADALQYVDDQGDKVALAMQLFGQEGTAMLQMMTGGSQSIAELREEAAKLGLTLSTEGANALADAGDSLAKVKANVDGLMQSLAVTFAPIIGEIAEEIAWWIQQNRELIALQLPEYLEDLKYYFGAIMDFIKEHTSMLSMGVIGFFLFGPQGAAILGLIGETMDRIKAIKAEIASVGSMQMAPGKTGLERLTDWRGGGSFWSDEPGPSTGGAAVNINVNQQVSRSDIANIASESARLQTRQ